MTSTLQSFIQNKLCDPWENTQYKGYVYLTPKDKGRFGELYVKEFMQENLLCQINDPESSTAGYDWIIDNIKTEVKFSLAIRKNGKVNPNKFIINHVSIGKDWERLIFFGVNPDNVIPVFITKEDFKQELNRTDCVFNHQQGGKGISNDDFMCTDVNKFIQRPYVKSIDQW